eukprot:TRINITY_DN6370_c0_g1_i2.p1 TRINITY_DN6370_c0_g1~~TRINITY_DN6370_c0_g1_i2.p1  ORF type:complete len:388 (-),score=37.64 TRINITY_DN6370_c0_g1_i2:224-1387(-)
MPFRAPRQNNRPDVVEQGILNLEGRCQSSEHGFIYAALLASTAISPSSGSAKQESRTIQICKRRRVMRPEPEAEATAQHAAANTCLQTGAAVVPSGARAVPREETSKDIDTTRNVTECALDDPPQIPFFSEVRADESGIRGSQSEVSQDLHFGVTHGYLESLIDRCRARDPAVSTDMELHGGNVPECHRQASQSLQLCTTKFYLESLMRNRTTHGPGLSNKVQIDSGSSPEASCLMPSQVSQRPEPSPCDETGRDVDAARNLRERALATFCQIPFFSDHPADEPRVRVSRGQEPEDLQFGVTHCYLESLIVKCRKRESAVPAEMELDSGNLPECLGHATQDLHFGVTKFYLESLIQSRSKHGPGFSAEAPSEDQGCALRRLATSHCR